MERPAALLDAYDSWQRLAGHRPRTLRARRHYATRFLHSLTERGHSLEGIVDLSALNPKLIADYQAELLQAIDRRTGQPLSSATQGHHLYGLKSFFNFLVKTKRISADPSRGLKLPRTRHALPQLLSPAAVRRLLTKPDLRTVLGYRDRTILELLWSTGLRATELLSLAVEDLDFERHLIHLREGKGGKARIIPLGRIAAAWLRNYIAEVRPHLARNLPLRDLFLSTIAGSVFSESQLGDMLKIYGRKVGLPHIKSHQFRHSLATEMLKAGADLRHIQQMLGHESLITTQRYLHLVKRDLAKVHSQTHPREQLPSAPVRFRGNPGIL